ncbi:MAG TPA: aminotransferase class I/II-fold pyridoxal phosphate-dependent enzyme [Steroidobacteraceae bacterium]|nr:aminotransferase class I/II-fold pyridoxal phosphate-dependent enzyme [Steroidobacteraceae bacterium]
MIDLTPVHGSTDSLPEPRYDFSSNANALGPCPPVLAAVRAADVSRYPDPLYTRLRARLAQWHGIEPDRIVVGAGASELILRLVRHFDRTVLQLAPTFSEYGRGAGIARTRVVSVSSPDSFLRAQKRRRSLAFLCCPNNPTGDVWEPAFVATAARQGPLVVDLAYAALCGSAQAADIEAAAANAWRLYSPNKAFGMTGVRGAYLIAPRTAGRVADEAPSWVIGRDAVAMLEACLEPAARAWLADSIPRLWRWRTRLAEGLRRLRLEVRESPATFLLAEVGDGGRVGKRLREAGIRVRDARSFGLERWIRVSAQPAPARKALLTTLAQCL